MGKSNRLGRPTKTTEYEIVIGSVQAKRGWIDLLATQKNLCADAWDRLSTNPQEHSDRMYPLKGELSSITRDGVSYVQRQYKYLSGGARIWYYIDEERKSVVLVRVFTSHPNETK